MEQKQLTLNGFKYENDINKLNKRRNIKFKIDRYMKDVNVILNLFWSVFLGIFFTFICCMIGSLYFITILGAPFGIIIYKTIPLVFKPVNKRVILNFSDFWFLNMLWLMCGGLFIAIIFLIITAFCYMSIIFIPIGIQIKKIAIYFFAPFGAEIVDNFEFSDEEIEKQAYTMQYLRKNNIKVNYDLLNVDENNKKIIDNLTNVKYQFTYHIFRISYSGIISFILLLIYFGFIGFIFYKIGFFDTDFAKSIFDFIISIPSFVHNVIMFLSTPLIYLLNLFFNLININIYNFVDLLVDVTVLILTIFFLIQLVEFIFILISGIVLLKVKRKKIYNYGFATRKELIKQYESNLKLRKKYYDLIHILYKLYEKEIDEEILKDTPSKKI